PIDIPDPIGLGLSAYIECRDALIAAMPGILKYLDQDQPMNTATSPTTSTSSPTSASTEQLRIAIGSDHAGLELKEAVRQFLNGRGDQVADLGTNAKESVDYNDFAEAVAQNVITGQADFGILMCSSGIGMSIMANRHPEIRAALVTNPADAAVT